jgi:putative transposase
LVLKICQISRSSYYYKPSPERKKVGKPASTFTKKLSGGYDNDSVVIEEIIKLLAMPFVDYGYLKTTFYLRDEKNYLINPKKVYRLMAENGLLYDNKGIREHSPRQWVKELVPNPIAAFTYFEFDIKYIYIQGKQRNAQVLTVLDVFSRWNMGHLIKWDIMVVSSSQNQFNSISKIKMLRKNSPNQRLLSKMLILNLTIVSWKESFVKDMSSMI